MSVLRFDIESIKRDMLLQESRRTCHLTQGKYLHMAAVLLKECFQKPNVVFQNNFLICGLILIILSSIEQEHK